jgi:hypothetical protein
MYMADSFCKSVVSCRGSWYHIDIAVLCRTGKSSTKPHLKRSMQIATDAVAHACPRTQILIDGQSKDCLIKLQPRVWGFNAVCVTVTVSFSGWDGILFQYQNVRVDIEMPEVASYHILPLVAKNWRAYSSTCLGLHLLSPTGGSISLNFTKLPPPKKKPSQHPQRRPDLADHGTLCQGPRL